MTTTLNLKRFFHLPRWELLNPTPAASVAGAFMCGLTLAMYQIAVAYECPNTTSTVYEYDPVSDTKINLPASGIAGTFGAGSCGKVHPMGPTGTASAGGASTLTTALTIPRDLRGYRIRITGGPGTGDERVILSNTQGANSVITVSSAFSVTITSSSTFRLMTPRFWVFNPAATPGFGYYDWALSAWTAGKSVSGVTFTVTDGCLEGTAGAAGNILDSSDSAGGATGTSSAAVYTLGAAAQGNSGRAWTVNQWAGAIMQVIAGTGAGQTKVITSNTATTITAASSWSTPLDATSVWQLTLAPSSSGTGTWSAANATTLTLTGVAWTTNQWANSQIRVISGTGAGQISIIASNTSTVLTFASMGTVLDATSVWVIEGNDDALYLAGNAAVALFKYSISGNTWATATATAARSAAPGAGMSLNWVSYVPDTTGLWSAQNAIKNQRYLYSFRGSAGNVLDIYDLALTTWTSGQAYANQNETFSTGVSWTVPAGSSRYIFGTQAVTGKFYAYDCLKNVLTQVTEHGFTQGAAVVGQRVMMLTYVDGSTTIQFLYHWMGTSTGFARELVWQMQ